MLFCLDAASKLSRNGVGSCNVCFFGSCFPGNYIRDLECALAHGLWQGSQVMQINTGMSYSG